MLDSTTSHSHIEQGHKLQAGLFTPAPRYKTAFARHDQIISSHSRTPGYLKDTILIQVCITGIISLIIGGIIITMLIVSASTALPKLGLVITSHIAAALVGILGGVFMHMAMLYMRELQPRPPQADLDKSQSEKVKADRRFSE